uniref:Uncharacterized protein n=1 Tax=Arundo donax TaxID=35708 RepID=A0A0A9EV54_ARUDO
MEPQFSFSKG